MIREQKEGNPNKPRKLDGLVGVEPPVRPRIVAIMGGGDWYDASVDHLIVPREIDLEAEKRKWDEWYQYVYCSPENQDRKVRYICFVEWLENIGAKQATDEYIEEFWDH